MIGTKNSDGITQSFDAIKLDTGYGLTVRGSEDLEWGENMCIVVIR